MNQAVDQGPPVIATAGMDNEARGFDKKQKIFILVKHLKIDTFGLNIGFLADLDAAADNLPCLEAITAFPANRIDEDKSLTD